MEMKAGQRALDKIYKRRDRYQIPSWQRTEVWDTKRKQALIDSILRGWKLPKFYFVKLDNDEYEVVDGQQRLSAIFEFFDNELELSAESRALFGGPNYRDLKTKLSDAFDDFEIEYDEIEDASEEELKEFFQRLQQGLTLNTSEKLNAVHSKLRDFCKESAEHQFFTTSVVAADTRFAHFDIMSKLVTLEIEGIDSGLRFEDVRGVFVGQKNFPSTSAVAKRVNATLDFLASAFPKPAPTLKNRTIVQAVITFAARLIETGKAKGLEGKVARFIDHFLKELSRQVELGQAATDSDYLRFQKSVNANIKAGPKIRQEILLRKAFMYDSALADAFDPSIFVKSGISGRVSELGSTIAEQIGRLNTTYSAVHGKDLFKATNKTSQALLTFGKPIKDFSAYKNFIDNLYFIFREGVGDRLDDNLPSSFVDVNTLRTDLQHDVDHGDKGKVAAKKKKIGETFSRYAGVASPDVLDQSRFLLVQANILSTLETDLRNLTIPIPTVTKSTT